MRRFFPHALMALLMLSLLPAAQVVAQNNTGQKGAFADEKTRTTPQTLRKRPGRAKLAPDSMTRPKDGGTLKLEQDGVHTATFNSIMKCDVDIRSDLYKSATRVIKVQTAKGAYGVKPTKRRIMLRAAVGGKQQGVKRFEINKKGALMLIGEDGKQAVAPAGIYTLSNGKKLHIGQAGMPVRK